MGMSGLEPIAFSWYKPVYDFLTNWVTILLKEKIRARTIMQPHRLFLVNYLYTNFTNEPFEDLKDLRPQCYFIFFQLMTILKTSRTIKRLLDETCLPPVRISLALYNETGHKRTHDKLEYTARFEDDVTGTQQWNWTAGLYTAYTEWALVTESVISLVCLFTELVYWTCVQCWRLLHKINSVTHLPKL